jgi:murein DD-endopeptidase MepM/ murein hydrolase activator NlpD
MPLPLPTATPTTTSLVTPQLCSPLAVQPLEKISEIITQPFKMPRVMDDGSYKDDGHHGLDLGYYTRDGKPFTGTAVLAALGGTIAAIIHDRPPYGNAIIIETPHAQIPAGLLDAQNIRDMDSLYTIYAHLQNLEPFDLGQPIPCGQRLAETGLTGFTSGPHLHFETRWGPPAVTFESIAYYRADATPVELANYETWRLSGAFHLFDPLELLKTR